MCLILIAYQTHPKYPLILLANRDEFYSRPTAQASFWSEDPEILGGKDLQAGGTWMGINKSGNIAALTNYRSLIINNMLSPGVNWSQILLKTKINPRLILTKCLN